MGLPGYSAEKSLYHPFHVYGMAFAGFARGDAIQPAGDPLCCAHCMGPCLVDNSQSVCLSRCSSQCGTSCGETCGACTSTQQCCNSAGQCWTVPCSVGTGFPLPHLPRPRPLPVLG
jgi:hypothetical protein